MASKLHPISKAEFLAMTTGMKRRKLKPSQLESVRASRQRVAAGESFPTTAEICR